MADPYVGAIRAAVLGARGPAFPARIDPQDGAAGSSGNHLLAIWVGRYGRDPDHARDGLMYWLRRMLARGLWCPRDADELGTSSHAAHWYAALDSLLYLAMVNGDKEVLDLIVKVEVANAAFENLCATPDGRIVTAGSRCHVAQGSADQRQIRNWRWQWLQGRKVRTPQVFDTADDWLGPWALKRLYDACRAGESWAAAWLGLDDGGILRLIRVAKIQPVTRNAWRIERGQHGHLVAMETLDGVMAPALWAVEDYRSSHERYGCDPAWPKEYHGAKVGDIPAPECPGGADRTRETTLPRST